MFIKFYRPLFSHKLILEREDEKKKNLALLKKFVHFSLLSLKTGKWYEGFLFFVFNKVLDYSVGILLHARK